MGHGTTQQAANGAHGVCCGVGIFMIIFLLGAGNGLINAMLYNSGRFLDTSMMVGGATPLNPMTVYRTGGA